MRLSNVNCHLAHLNENKLKFDNLQQIHTNISTQVKEKRIYMFPLRLCAFAHDTFDEAHRSMGHYEQHSDAPESSAEQEKKRNTVKPPRFLTTDDDDGDVDDDTGADDGDDDGDDDDDDESILVPNQGHKKGKPVPSASHQKQQPSEKGKLCRIDPRLCYL